MIRVDYDTFSQLSDLRENKETKHLTIRFGNLNLICCVSDEEYAVWRVGTSQLIRESKPKKPGLFEITHTTEKENPINRERATALFDKLGEPVGVRCIGSGQSKE